MTLSVKRWSKTKKEKRTHAVQKQAENMQHQKENKT